LFDSALVVYCLFQFVITILTVSEVGAVYISEFRKAGSSAAGSPEEKRD
jgi:hypothetical protein